MSSLEQGAIESVRVVSLFEFGKGKGAIYRMLEQYGSGMLIQACSFASTSVHKSLCLENSIATRLRAKKRYSAVWE